MIRGADCTKLAGATLERVAERVYREASGGRILMEAVRRVTRSRALALAVERDDPATARLVLHSLIESQIVRIEVLRGGLQGARVLASVGHVAALAPTVGVLRNAQGLPIGSFVLSVQGANGYAHTVRGYTGARVIVTDGARPLADTLVRARGQSSAVRRSRRRRRVGHGTVGQRAVSFTGEAFPSGALRVRLMLPRSSNPPCDVSAGQIEAQALGEVAVRIYAAEHAGARTRAIVRHVERSQTFRAAVLSGDPNAVRGAIVGLFRTHLHVVRVRAWIHNRLLTDLGGPFVLAPAAGVVRDRRGRVAGRFLLASQDDMGFMLLAHSFTGAQVLMRVGSEQVMSTLGPGPASIPERGPVTYGGVNYEAFSFSATAFPSGALRISLLVAEAA